MQGGLQDMIQKISSSDSAEGEWRQWDSQDTQQPGSGCLGRGVGWRSLAALSALAVVLSSCSFDPNVRKQKMLESGQRYFEKHQYSEAAIEFANATRIDPGFAEAHWRLAESYLNMQLPDRARQELARTIELRPEDFQARMAMENVLTREHRFQEAQQEADVLLGKRPFDPAVHSSVASLLAAENNISGAIAETQQAIGLDPGRWELYLSLGLLQSKGNQPDLAEASFKKVIDLNPKEVQARLLLGEFYESHRRLDEAERQYQDAIGLDSTTLTARSLLAQLYLNQGRRADAEGVLLRAKHDLPRNPESFLALSNFYYATGDLNRAVAEYDSLYKEHSGDLQIKKKYIQLLIRADRFDEARKLDDELLKASPNDEEALIYRSQMQISSGHFLEAAQILQPVIRNSPQNSQAHYVLGVALDRQGNPGQAESEWREALRINPEMVDAESALAAAALRKGDTATLEEAATQLIKLRPWSPDGYALRGLANLQQNHYSEAEADIRKAIGVAPAQAIGYVQLGNLKLAQKQYPDAVRAFQDALDRNMDSTDALRGLMNTYLAERQVDKAEATVNAQIAKSPANSRFYELLGAILFHSKKELGAAEAALQKSVELDPRNSAAILLLCQVEAARGHVAQAIAVGERSLKDDPRQAGLTVLVANLHASMGEWKQAENDFQIVLANDSNNPLAANGLARVMLHTGESLDVALSLAETARRGLPNSSGVADTVGWIYYRKGIYALAISNLQDALNLQEKERSPDDPDIHYHLGMAYKSGAQPALARQQLEHVLKMNPGYRGAAEVKRELTHLES